ncbi:sigma-70 family RNA polymerase sigma factor [Ravibacter arvi]|uniref:Sigma-70 family RNA polymerase sigma factor n=1 Tax=Ravibacter arvi TaxID=2051041 RepID=A0ABP8M8Z6_9BACT
MDKQQDTGNAPDRDQLLWQRITGDDREALGELFEIYARELLTYGFRIHADLGMVKDVLQDVFVDIWTYRKNLAGAVKVKFYLYQCLRNALFKQLARERKVPSEDIGVKEIPDTESSPEAVFVQLEDEMDRQDRLRLSLEALTPREREVISLKYYSNLKIREIAKLLELKEQTIANTLQNALSKLRKCLVNNFFLFFL